MDRRPQARRHLHEPSNEGVRRSRDRQMARDLGQPDVELAKPPDHAHGLVLGRQHLMVESCRDDGPGGLLHQISDQVLLAHLEPPGLRGPHDEDTQDLTFGHQRDREDRDEALTGEHGRPGSWIEQPVAPEDLP